MTAAYWFFPSRSEDETTDGSRNVAGSEQQQRGRKANVTSLENVGGNPDAEVQDRALLARVAVNDTAALSALMAVYVPRLAHFAMTITRSRETAAEVVQDVFIRVWELRETLDIRGSVAGYLWSATRNRALNARRHEHVMDRTTGTVIQDMSSTSHLAYNDGAEKLDVESVAAELMAIVGELPARVAEIFLLRWEHGLQAEDIATLLGLSLSTVRSQLSRAVRHMESRLKRG